MERILQFDHQLFFFLNSIHCAPLDIFFSLINCLGWGWLAGPLTALPIILFCIQRKNWAPLGIAIVAMSCAGIFNGYLKDTFHRSRPLVYAEKIHAQIVSGSSSTASISKTKPTIHIVGPSLRTRAFPSGHTETAFSAAITLVLLLGKKWRWTFIAAFFAGYARIYMGAHWPADVLGGALVGVVFTGTIILLATRLINLTPKTPLAKPLKLSSYPLTLPIEPAKNPRDNREEHHG